MQFKLEATDPSSKARAGKMTLAHGVVDTPIFMPVGTTGTVKGVHQHELKEDIQAQIILSNAYHLYLRPGPEILEAAGGLHKFIGWNKPILTDSGGYQVYSQADTRRITEEGVHFRSHIDGRKLFFSPEVAIDIQRVIGADIIMAFDECPPYPCDYQYASKSMHMTHHWLRRCCVHFDKGKGKYGYGQTLLPIVQGSVYADLRKQSAEFIASMDREANAIGGLSVGEPKEEMYEITDVVTGILPADRPRYLMGVGTPANILEGIGLGIDLFDCVMPTRNARNGQIFTLEGIINLKNKKWASDLGPLDPNGTSYVDRAYNRAYVRHLIHSNEHLGKQITSIHNLAFYLWLVKEARKHILAGDFRSWKDQMVPKLEYRL